MKLTLLLVSLSFLAISCSKTIDNVGTCSDGIRNQGEFDVDCGGPCPALCPSCADGVRNQNETAVDCGGSCDPCYPRLCSKVDGQIWNSGSRNAQLSAPGALRIYGAGSLQSITLFYSGPFEVGTTQAGVSFRGEYRDSNGTLFESSAGFIQIHLFDTTERKIAGIFSFEAVESAGTVTKTIDSGIFTELSY